MTWLLRAGLVLAIVGATWLATPSPIVEGRYGAVAARTFGRLDAPRALIDQAHFNGRTMNDGLSAFAAMLRRDGYRVAALSAPLSARSLRECDVLVIVDALGVRGWLRYSAARAGVRWAPDLGARAFAPDEVRAVEAWVRNGGRLWLVASEALAGEAAADLASAFGVETREAWTTDVEARGRRVTLEHGAGRVVVDPAPPQGNENPQPVLDVMHWLSGVFP